MSPLVERDEARPETVLVVDDEAAGRYVSARLLSQAGLRVVEAGTGAEALARAAEGVDLVLLDVNLPDMDGFEVCRRLRADPATAALAVLHLSATRADAQALVAGLDGGADGYLMQPVEPEVLVATVRSLLRASRAERRARERRVLLETVVETASDPIYVKDLDGCYVLVNEAAAKALGCRREEMIGRTDADLLRPEDARALQANDARALAAPGGVTDEERVLIGGEQRVFLTARTPVRESSGQLAGLVAVLHDITPRTRAEERLRALQRVTAALSGVASRRAAVEAVTAGAAGVLGANGVGIAWLDGADDEHFEVTVSGEAGDRPHRIPRDTATAMGAAACTGARVLASTRADWRARFPAGAAQAGEDQRSILSLPLVVSGRRAGAIGLTFPREGDLAAEDLGFAESLAEQVAQTLDRLALTDARTRARERGIALQQATADLAACVGSDDVAAVTVDHARRFTGAASASLLAVDASSDDLVMLARSGAAPPPGAPSRLPMGSPRPAAEAARTRRLLWMRSPESLPREPGPAAEIFVPLALGGRVLGVLVVGFADAPSAPNDCAEALEALAGVAAQALERARLYEDERAARMESDRLRRRVSVLDEASLALERALGFRARAERLVELAAREMQAVAVLFGAGTRGNPHVLAAAGPDGLLDLRGRVETPTPVERVMRGGRAELLSRIDSARTLPLPTGPDPISLRSAVVVPLVAQGVTVAVLMVASEAAGRFGAGDLMLAEELGRRAAIALENARLYERERNIAQILQQGLLPATLPDIPGMEVAAAFRPLETDVGGDFYDVFAVSDGWDVVIGDVCGKGPQAAQLTALARHTVRAAAMGEPREWPSHILSLLNRAVLDQVPDNRFLTALYGRLRPGDDGRMELALARGGHLPALVVRRNGKVAALRPGGPLLGVYGGAAFEDGRASLGAGDSLVMFTDGLTEARRGAVLFGERRVANILSRHAMEGATSMVGALEHALAAFAPGSPADDLAVVALTVRPDPEA